ncbi:MAG: wax ester/triacylglycerol synthase family O-acyltransferase [Solirubrobacterales bacterium]
MAEAETRAVAEAETLTALDATFLELEQADDSAHMHIGAVMVFEPLGEGLAPDPTEVARHLSRRLGSMPRYRQRLSEPRTGGISWPRWVEDPAFEVGAQIHRAALPSPGGEGELLEWAGEYFSQRLDRSRPLWDLVVLEGLAGGRWALASKTHHCMVDGVGSVDVTDLLLDSERVPPGGREVGEGKAPRAVPAPAGGPGGVEGAVRSLASGAIGVAGSVVRLPIRAAGAGLAVVRHPERARDALERSRAVADVLVRDEANAAPRTSLNEPIGGHRRLAVMRVSLEELRRIKVALGGTVNDIVLAISAGGFRDLLEARGEEPPEAGLRAMVPMNIRSAGEHLDLGNRITSLFVHLPVYEPDPMRRYRLQVEEAEELKSGSQGTGSKTLVDLTALAPPAIHSFLARGLFATRLFNVTITNVPGPPSARYAFGSRMSEVWPLVPLAASHAVGIAVISYDGDLHFCINADRDSVPDLAVLRDGMARSLAFLREAAAEAAGQAAG